MKNNGSTFTLIGKLGSKFLCGQFWPRIAFASLSVPSGIAPSPYFCSCGPKSGLSIVGLLNCGVMGERDKV